MELYISTKECPKCGYKQWIVPDGYVPNMVREKNIPLKQFKTMQKENDDLLKAAVCMICTYGNPLGNRMVSSIADEFPAAKVGLG